MLYFFHFFYSISPCSLSSSLSTSVLSSSHLSETLKLTLTISPETHHLSSSSSQTDVIPAEARPTAVPATDRLRPTSRPKPQAVARFHRRSSIQALDFIVEAAAAFLVVGFSVNPSFGFFFFSCCGWVVVVVVVVAVADGRGGYGWCYGFFWYWDILFYCSGL